MSRIKLILPDLAKNVPQRVTVRAQEYDEDRQPIPDKPEIVGGDGDVFRVPTECPKHVAVMLVRQQRAEWVDGPPPPTSQARRRRRAAAAA